MISTSSILLFQLIKTNIDMFQLLSKLANPLLVLSTTAVIFNGQM
jgi:hypothetical protein